MTKTFYVYAHYTPGSPAPFYIGKGKGRRANSRGGRSDWWKHIVAKYCPDGPDVRVLSEGLTEEESFTIEKFWVAVFGRRKTRVDGCLINLTDGGEGVCGVVRSPELRRRMSEAVMGEKNNRFGKTHSEGTKRKMSEAHKGRVHTPEARKNMSKAQTGKKMPKRSAEHCRRISEAKRGERHPMFGKTGTENPNFGSTRTPEARANISKALKGRKLPPEHCRAISEAQKARHMRAAKALQHLRDA